jgi:hypothetical protein
MEQVLEPVLGDGVFCYVDDLVIFADDESEMLEKVEKVRALLAASDLRLSAKKARILQRQIEFLGRTVRHGEIAVSEKHREAIKEYEQPSDVRGLQRFLGMVNYHRAYVPRLGDDVAWLVKLEQRSRKARGPPTNGADRRRGETIPLLWDEKEKEVFEGLRGKMASPPVLTVPDMGKLDGRVRIDTDAATDAKEHRGGLGGAR